MYLLFDNKPSNIFIGVISFNEGASSGKVLQLRAKENIILSYVINCKKFTWNKGCKQNISWENYKNKIAKFITK